MNDLWDQRSPWNASTEAAMQKSVELPTNWVGNKRKLIRQLLQFLHDMDVRFDDVFDAFAGSGVFSLAMATEGKNVTANDAMLLSSTWLAMLLERRGNPLSMDEASAVALSKGSHGRHDLGFLREKFVKQLDVLLPGEVDLLESYRGSVASVLGGEMACGKVFPRDESFWNLGREPKGDPFKAAFAMQAMCVQILQKCFLGGRPFKKQALARTDHRLKLGSVVMGVNSKTITGEGALGWMRHNCYPTISTDAVLDMMPRPPKATVFCMDAVELTAKMEGELAYFDPPYGGHNSDYATMYGACEGFLRGMPVQDCGPLVKASSRFQKNRRYAADFKELLDVGGGFRTWLLSFNERSFASIDDIVSIIKGFGRDVTVREVDGYGYKYRLPTKHGREFMILADKR